MAVLSITLSLLLLLILLFPTILHWVYRAPRIAEQGTPAASGMSFQELFVPTVKNKQLFAWFIPANNSAMTLVVVHGWGGNAEMMLPLAKPFHEAGINVLLYDARNHGKSDPDSFSSLPRFAEDLDHALAWVKANRPSDQILVMGHSIGAAAAILAASRRSDIGLLLGLSGFAHPHLVLGRHLNRPWLPPFLRTLIMSYIQWVIGFRFDDIAPMNCITLVNCPVLLAHGTDDRVVPIEDMHLIASRTTAQRPVEILAVPGAKHDSVEIFQQQAHRLIQFIRDQLPTGPIEICRP